MMRPLEKSSDRNSYQVVSAPDEEISRKTNLDPGAHSAREVIPEVPCPISFLTGPARVRSRIIGGPQENVRYPALADSQNDLPCVVP
jgi:hypothetical protein